MRVPEKAVEMGWVMPMVRVIERRKSPSAHMAIRVMGVSSSLRLNALERTVTVMAPVTPRT